MSDGHVMAIGDTGEPELTPIENVVEIGCLPVGPDNICIPASIRALRRHPTERAPVRLISIRKPGTRLNPRPFPLVTFQCTPYERYRTNEGPVLGDVASCYVCSERQAHDPLFDSLTVRERFRILAAARTR